MKTVCVNLLSNSIGDTIAATPYVSEYQKKHQVTVYYRINNRLIYLLKEIKSANNKNIEEQIKRIIG